MNLERMRRLGHLHAFGSGGGGGGGTQDVTTRSEPAAFQLPYLQQLMQGAGNYLSGPPPSYYPGSTVAPFTPAQEAGQQQVLDYATGSLPGLASTALASNQFTMGAALDPASNPYLQATAQNAALPIIRGYEQVTRPQIQNEALAAGQYGGSRQGIAEGIAGQGAVDAVARNTYGLFTDAYGRALDNAVRSQAIAPSLLGVGTLPGTVVSGVGEVQQGMNQALTNEDIARYMFNQNAPVTQLQQYGNLVGGNFGGTTQSSGVSTGPQVNPIAGALGGAATGYAVGSSLGTALGWGAAAGPWGAAAGAALGLLGLLRN